MSLGEKYGDLKTIQGIIGSIFYKKERELTKIECTN